jgi:Cu(I)/Ag(I) efflux system membrane fusion protein
MKYTTFLFVAVLTILIGCSEKSKQISPQKPTAQMKKKPVVKAITIKPQPISLSIKVAGTIESKMQTTVNAPAEGVIASLNVNEGDEVKAGSVLGYVVTTDQQNMLALATGEYELQKSNAGNGEDSEKIIAARKKLDMAEQLYKPYPIVSPANGIVISKTMESGSNVNVRQPIMVIADIKQLIVKTAVPERFLSTIKKGQLVKLSIPALGKTILQGKIEMIYPSVDVRTRTCGIEITVAQNYSLKPGMTAVSEIVIAAKESAIAVPHDAVVIKPNGDKQIFTVTESKARAQKIETGIETNKLIEITSGISIGDMVIVAGNESLKDGTEITVSQPELQNSKNEKKGGN